MPITFLKALGDWTGWSEWLCNMCGSDDPGVETRARTCTGDAANCPGQGREKRDPCPIVAQQLAEGMKPCMYMLCVAEFEVTIQKQIIYHMPLFFCK